MKKIAYIKRFFVTAATVAAVSGCSLDVPYEIAGSLFVDAKTLNLYYGDTHQLTASPSEATFIWSSDDESIAKVSQSGLVEATGFGVTNIIASTGDVSNKILVQVTYPTIDAAVARSGHSRIRLDITINSDRVKTVKAIRLDNNTSQEFDINFRQGTTEVYYTDLPEGKYAFNLIAIDKYGNEADPLKVEGNAYADKFESTMTNRGISAATLFGNGLAIKWSNTRGDFMEVEYTDRYGQTVHTQFDKVLENTYIYGFGSDLRYRTRYLPDQNACDTFSTAYADYSSVTDKHCVLSKDAPFTMPFIDFDLGGEGEAYHDTGSGNDGGNAYRANNGDALGGGVDIGSDMAIGWTNDNEWWNYTVDVKDAGAYDFEIESSVNSGTNIVITLDGVQLDSYYLASTGGWANWTWNYKKEFNFPAGVHVMRITYLNGGTNFRTMKFTYK